MLAPKPGLADTLKGSVLTVRIFIAAHIRLYREGLAAILAREEDIEVIGTAGDRGALLAGVEAHAPDVVLVDAGIPGSLNLVRDVADPGSGPHVVALALPETDSDLIEYAEAGVAGYVTVHQSLPELLAMIRGVGKGELLCSARVAGALVRHVAALAAERSLGSSDVRLTAREMEVMRLVDEGLSNKQIAFRLCIELPTVKNHVHRILEKLDVSSRTAAVARLRSRGLLHA